MLFSGGWVILPFLLYNCAENQSHQVLSEQTGLALRVDIVGDTDVVGFEIGATPCQVSGFGGFVENDEFEGSGDGVGNVHTESITYVVDLEDMPLQMGEGSPFDPGTTHVFADQFIVLEPGCYDIYAQPITDLDTRRISDDCNRADAYEQIVEANHTTEVVLVSQCSSDEVGAIDVVATLNNAPTIHGGEYEPSKFIFDCEIATFCLEYEDANDDPVDIEWHQRNGPSDAIISGQETSPGCFEFAFEELGDYAFEVIIFDKFVGDDGELVRAETWFSDRGRNEQSRASLEILFHVGTNGEFLCFDGQDVSNLPNTGNTHFTLTSPTNRREKFNLFLREGTLQTIYILPPLTGTENCENGIDDDNDNRIDCSDPECSETVTCGGIGNRFHLDRPYSY